VEPRIVGGHTLTGQYAPLDYRVVDVARYDRDEFGEFISARSGGIIVTHRVPSRKCSVLLDRLAVLREWRHDQAPAYKCEHGSMAWFHGWSQLKLISQLVRFSF
jgi:hypothetical protein